MQVYERFQPHTLDNYNTRVLGTDLLRSQTRSALLELEQNSMIDDASAEIYSPPLIAHGDQAKGHQEILR